MNTAALWRRDVPLADRTTWRVGGPADFLFAPETPEQAAAAYAEARSKGIDVLVLGRGSNVVIADAGFRGLVLALSERMTAAALETDPESGALVLRARAGAKLAALAASAVKAGGAGMEKLAGIPGSLGGAVLMNAGAYGAETAAIVRKVVVCDAEGRLSEFPAGECGFGYRESRFKGSDALILEVECRCEPGDPAELRRVMEEHLAMRREKQPLSLPNAGSLFKRPEGDFAGRLVEAAGLKGFRVGDAAISEKHAGFAVNLGRATAADVRKLAEEVQRRVFEHSGVRLETEQIFVGF